MTKDTDTSIPHIQNCPVCDEPQPILAGCKSGFMVICTFCPAHTAPYPTQAKAVKAWHGGKVSTDFEE